MKSNEPTYCEFTVLKCSMLGMSLDDFIGAEKAISTSADSGYLRGGNMADINGGKGGGDVTGVGNSSNVRVTMSPAVGVGRAEQHPCWGLPQRYGPTPLQPKQLNELNQRFPLYHGHRGPRHHQFSRYLARLEAGRARAVLAVPRCVSTVTRPDRRGKPARRTKPPPRLAPSAVLPAFTTHKHTDSLRLPSSPPHQHASSPVH